LTYKQSSTIFDLAASYGYGFARNHCFPDGNKRVALESIDVFLIANGHELIAREMEAMITTNALAEGRMSENDLSAWIESNATALLEKI
jgi:death-on-curing protein